MNLSSSFKNTVKNFGALSLQDQLIIAVFILIAGSSLWCESIGWNNPIIDAHGFRQTQTAISVYWMLHGGPWLAYQTPVLGPPWSIPFEFPLYQWIVALAVRFLNAPLDQAGRFVSVVFWYLTLFPAYHLLGTLGIAKTRRLIFLSLFLICPLYLFWSRTFMMESTALFFGMAYLAAVPVALRRNDWRWAALASLLGTLGALVKITTFAGFGYAAFILVLYDWWTASRFKLSIIIIRKHFISLLCFALIPIIFEIIWLKYTDGLKAANPIAGEYLTASALSGWNFGNLAQRLSSGLWVDAIYRRMIPEILGSSIVLWLCCLLVILRVLRAQHGGKLLPVFSAGLFLAVILTFTNVHIVHSYYQYGNAIFLVGAVGFIINSQLDYGTRGKTFAAILFVFVGTLCLRYYLHNLYPVQAENLHDAPAIQVANAVRDMSKKDDVIVIDGYDWDSTLPYYSQRKALMDWPNTNYSYGVLESHLKALQDYHVGALVACGKAMNQTGILQRATAMLHLGPIPVYQNTLCMIYAPVTGMIASLPAEYAAYHQTMDGVCNLETIDGQNTQAGTIEANAKQPLTLSGWAIDKNDGQLPAAVYMRLNDSRGHTYFARVYQQINRPDVAESFGNPQYTMAGYAVAIDIRSLTDGRYSVIPLLVMRNGPVSECDSAARTIIVSHSEPNPTPPMKNSVTPGNYAQLPDLGTAKLYSLDRIDGKPFSGLPIRIKKGTPNITFNGWAVDSDARTLAAAVIAFVNDKSVDLTSYGDARPDVARVYANPNYAKSGFHGTIDTSDLKVGAYRLSLRIVNADRSGYYLGGPWILIVE